MGKKHWLETAQECLEECLVPVPHEVNELDWKVRLSGNKEGLIEHLIASANYPDGGYLVFGVNDEGQLEVGMLMLNSATPSWESLRASSSYWA